MTTHERWRYALKPASWPKLLVPTAVGQALGAAHLGRIDLVAALAGFGLTLTMLAFIVLSNDYADKEVDSIKRRRLPGGCSPKTIPDAILPARHVLFGGIVAGFATLAWAWWCASWLNRPMLPIATTFALFLFAAYSLPPLKLNYRGGGELLEMVGVGFALPWIQAYVQGGLGVETLAWLPRPWAVLIGLMSLALASAIASGLSDEQSDREGGKTTFVTKRGNPMARRATESFVLVGALAWIIAGLLSTHVPVLAVLLPTGIVLWHWRTMRELSTSAVTNAFRVQGEYKIALHKAIWSGSRWLAMLLVMLRILVP